MIEFDFKTYMPDYDTSAYQNKIENIKCKLKNDNDMLDWYHLGKCISQSELEDIKKTSKFIQENCDVFIVIGIGGSFLGAKAVIEALSPYFKRENPEIIFAGTSLSAAYLNELLEYIKDKQVIINIISKSGTTLEPEINFDVLYKFMNEKYNEEELKQRIIVTTDAKSGNLRKIVSDKGYKSFIVPDQIGGRFSVLTAVGLLPIATAGFNIDLLLEGASSCNEEDSFNYAIIRDILYRTDHKIESFSVYEPKLEYFAEWLKQLFGETQGKDKKGLLPTSVINTRDLHSLGQYYQDGERILFETVIKINNTADLYVDKYNLSLDQINAIAISSVAKAHLSADVYSNIITIDLLNEKTIGHLIYFFEVAAAVGAYLLNQNPFDQPGVNAYKHLINQKLKPGVMV